MKEKFMPRSKFDVERDEMRKGYIEGGHSIPIRTKVPKADRRCFQMSGEPKRFTDNERAKLFRLHVSHHIRDLHYSPQQAVAIAYAEERKGKLKGVCKVRKVS
jgi:hypothetical protein